MSDQTQELLAAEFAGAPIEPKQRERKRFNLRALRLEEPAKISLRSLQDILFTYVMSEVNGAVIVFEDWDGPTLITYEIIAVMLPTDWLADNRWQVLKIDVSKSVKGYVAILCRQLAIQSGHSLTTPQPEGEIALQKIRSKLFNSAPEPVAAGAYAQAPVGTIIQPTGPRKPGLMAALEAGSQPIGSLPAAVRSEVSSATGISV